MARGRALEAILGCEDFDAETAERYGWINRALPDGELGPFVDGLARRIASFPPRAIALAKRAMEAAELPTREGLLEEAWCFQQTLGLEETKSRLAQFLEQGGQTRAVELELAGVLDRLGRPEGEAQE